MGRTLLGSLASATRTLLGRAPVAFVAPGARAPLGMLGTSYAGSEAQLRAMGSVGTLFAIVNRTSNATAQVEWKLYRKATDRRRRYSGGEAVDIRVEVTRHAALDLWNKPNPFMPRQEFVEAFQQHHDLTGEAWWVVARDDRAKVPVELWPVRPDRMEPVPHPEDFLSGYVYRSPGGERVPLELDEVIQLRSPNPLDPYRGMGPVQTLLTDLDATKYSAEWNRNFFLNSAEPGGIIEVPESLSDGEFNELRTRWNEQHRGVANAHRVAILEHGKWVDRKFSQRDMQFAELRAVSREIIREAFGFPKPMLGATDDVNRANAEAAEVVFARWLIVPRLERIKAALNHDLLPLFGAAGEGLEFDYVSPVPEDREADAAELTARSNAASVLVDAGWEPADVLTTVGLPEMQYAGLRPADNPPPEAPPPAVPAARFSRARPADPFAAARARLLAQDDDGGGGGDRLEHVRRDHEQALADLLARWDAVEADWYDALSEQIRDAVDQGDAAGLADLTLDSGTAAGVLRRALGVMAQQGAQQVVDESAAQGVNLTAPEADPALTNRRLAGIRNMFGSELVDIAAAVASLLASGMAASAAAESLRLFRKGADGRDIASKVVGFLRGLVGRARTDQLGGVLHRAQNTGRLAAMAAGPTARWIATEVHDGNTCLAPEVRVTIRDGMVPAKDVTLDDELLTHSGRWTKPSRIVVSEVEEQLTRVVLADGRSLRLTWDHPVFVRIGDSFAWRNAGNLAVGDLVVDQSTLELGREVGAVDLGLGQAPYGVSTVGYVGGLASVDVRAQRVPVVPVGFDHEGLANKEVHDPGADLGLGSVGAPEVFESLADSALDAGLSIAGSVTAGRAVAGSSGPGRDDAELIAAVTAVDGGRRASAALGAVAPVVDLGVPERRSAPLAGGVDSPRVATRSGAADVPVSGADRDAEPFAALGADLGDALQRSADLGEELWVGELALCRAVDGAGSPSDFSRAGLTENRRPVRVLAQPGGTHGTAPAERALLDRDTACRTRPIHELILQVATCQVVAVERELYDGEVFDFTIPDDETFWAEGVLVHNCSPCDEIDGTEFPDLAAAEAAYAGGAYIDCLGGIRCRGTVIAIWDQGGDG